MQLFVLVLNEVEYLEDVLTFYVEVGVAGATVLDSVGMGRFLLEDIPIFAGFRDFLKGNHPFNKTVLAVVAEDMPAKLAAGIDKILGGLSEGKGVMFALPVGHHWGVKGSDTEDE